MQLSDCINRIDRYLKTGDRTPRFVNVRNKVDFEQIVQRFKVGSNIFLPIERYADNDENPQMDRLQNDLANQSGNVFVTGLTSQLKLWGERVLVKELNTIASQSFRARVVILCYQCEKYLDFLDRRLKRLVYDVEGVRTAPAELVFTLPEMAVPEAVDVVEGIQRIASALESVKMDNAILYVKTRKQKRSYPESLFYIREEKDAFEALRHLDQATRRLHMAFGSEEQWRYALEQINQVGSWGALLNKQFGTNTNLGLFVGNWQSFDPMEKWLYFIGLKLYGAGDNWCLGYAITQAENMDTLVRHVYRSLLSIDHDAPGFWEKYDERKRLIAALGGSGAEILDYLQMTRSKEAKAFYYLTDASKIEKEMIFELLDKYALQYEREAIIQILKHIYPDLYAYLQPYRFAEAFMNRYFQAYKYQKVVNAIYPEFLSMVEEQAKERRFNFWLPPRSEKIEALNKNGARLYFVDALGVEYLGFILEKCKDLNLMVDISVCRCELPSITAWNKDFLEMFDDVAPPVKKLDDIKHHGEESFDYQQTKLPIHLMRELEVVNEVLMEIHSRLAMGTIERAYIIADHGSSRLAVIHESECKWEMASKGEHSGRCCPVHEADVQSEYAIEANGFWVLANYDRFKGGRKANVEVHGGGTLEEVAVPIIELTYMTGEIEVSIHSPLPLAISFKKKAELLLFSKTKLGGVTVCVNGKKVDNQYYDAKPQDNNFYLVSMPDIKYAGTYQMTVFSNNNLVAELEFSVKKESATERDIL